MAAVAIPEKHQEALKTFVALDDKSAQKFVDALAAASPALSINTLAKKLTAAGGQSEALTKQLVLMLGGMSLARSTSGLAVDKFVDSIRRAAFEEKILPPEAESEWPKVAKHMASALRTRAVEISSKAISVLLDNERSICTVRILSDLRTIFSDDGKLEASACLVLHNLRLSVHESGDYKETAETYVTLERSDLVKLKATIDRALLKHDKLVAMAGKLELPVLASEE
jgi:hypothetical protein